MKKLLAAAVFLAALAAFAVTAAAADTASETSEPIAFTRDKAVYVMGADGTGVRLLWQGKRRVLDVAWFPDGAKLAVGTGALWGTRGGGIWVMNADGSNPVRVAGVPAASLTWSPDGRRIAFTRRYESDNPDIWVMDADGSNIRRLKRTPLWEWNVDWKPTGGWLAFDRGGYVSQLYVIRTNGRNLQVIGSSTFWDAREPDWSPDGRRLAFRALPRGTTGDADSEIWVMNANGTSPVRLTRNDVYDGSPAWSPDRRKIVFVRGENPDSSEIYVMNADGTGARKLTKGASPAWQP
jgi:Tol biopolymer transport system component